MDIYKLVILFWKDCRENYNKRVDNGTDDSKISQIYLKLPYQEMNAEIIVEKLKWKLHHTKIYVVFAKIFDVR